MIEFPDQPFLTDDFSPKGGGLDFLGTRWVNLTILGDYLLPGINNATRDFGTYCLAAWIPWKFRSLCQDQKDFTFSNYRKFREAVEVMMSYAMRDDSSSTLKYNNARNRVGMQQKLSFPTDLSFKEAHRKESNTIYTAALYGPSLRYLSLLGFAQDKDGRPTNLLLANDDSTTTAIVRDVDNCLRRSSFYYVVDQMAPPSIDATAIDDLGINGLNPAVFKEADTGMKKNFLKKLLPKENGDQNGRTFTARLIGHTLKSCVSLNVQQLRHVWHTGLTPLGILLPVESENIQQHRKIWSIFQCRQIQRTFLELFLQAFEIAVHNYSHTIEEIVDFTINEWEQTEESVPANLNDLVRRETAWLSDTFEFDVASIAWNELVHGEHSFYENIQSDTIDIPVIRAVKMMTRWFLRTRLWIDRFSQHQNFFCMGGPERISISFCLDWINDRLSYSFKDLLKNLFTDFIFVQHMRIALGRFDGRTQRLRFIIGDQGIVPTLSVGKSIGKGFEVMADRLECFLGLLTDLNVIDENVDHTFSLGNNADYIL